MCSDSKLERGVRAMMLTASLRSVVSGCSLPFHPSPSNGISFFTEIVGVPADFLPFGEKTFLNTDTSNFVTSPFTFALVLDIEEQKRLLFLEKKVWIQGSG